MREAACFLHALVAINTNLFILKSPSTERDTYISTDVDTTKGRCNSVVSTLDL